MKKSLLSVLLLTLFSTLTACNTIQGLGTDIKKGGEAIEKAADKGK